MDEEEFAKLNSEIEALARPDPEDGDVDTPDGFRKFVKRQLTKFSCIAQKSDQEKAENNSAASGTDKAAAAAKPSTSSQDFQESRTALVASETRTQGDRDSDVYNFNYPKRGLAVIINNENFLKYSRGEFGDRPGSSYDRAYLYRTFTALGFDVVVHNDLKAVQMVEALRQAAAWYNHSQVDCFVCAILTHGDQTWTERQYDRMGTRVRQDLLFGVDGKVLATKTALELFNDKNCPGLAGKPRLFFLQACRGAKYDDGQTVQVVRQRFTPGIRPDGGDSRDGESGVDYTDQKDFQRSQSLSSSVDPPEYHQKLTDHVDAKPETQLKETGQAGTINPLKPGKTGVTDQTDTVWSPVRNVPISPAPLYKDFLVMYATPPGHFAWRRKNGAWFVQSLCNLLISPLTEHKSLLNILVKVVGLVAREYKSENPNSPEMDQKKECPVIESMLVKDVFLKKKPFTVIVT